MASSRILTLLRQHVEAHQRSEDLSTSARVTHIQQELEKLSLETAVEQLSIDENTPRSPKEDLTEALLFVCDCAVATEGNSESQHAISRVLELTSAVAAAQNVSKALLQRAFDFSAVLLERVRVTACQLVGFVVQYNDKMEVEAAALLVERLTDKSQAVRQAAILACANFFNQSATVEESVFSNAQASVREALLYNLQHDPSVSNRVAAVSSVPLDESTIPYVLDRLRDVKPKVRVAALQALQTVALQSLTAEQCAHVIRSGVTERCAATKEEASKLISVAWIKAVKYNPLDLLRHVNVVLHESECELALGVLLQASESPETWLQDELSDPEIRALQDGLQKAICTIDEASALEAEAVVLARIVCHRAIQASNADALLSRVVPDIPILCQVFESHTVKLMQAIDQDDEETEDNLTCICLQLLQLASMADLEEGSRRHFGGVMKRVLSSVTTPDDLVEGCLSALKSLYDKEADFVDTITEVVSELSVHTQDDDALAENHVLRILSILTIVLEHISPRMASNLAVADFCQHVMPAVTHSNHLVRQAGVSCYGKMGLFTNQEQVLQEFKPLLLQIADNADERVEIRAQAMLALSDWSMLFVDMLEPCTIDGTEVSLTQLVSGLLTHSKPAMICIAAEVATKLLFSGKVQESAWLAQLLMLFFDEDMAELAEEDDEDEQAVKVVGSPVRLQQLLSLFFSAYSVKSKRGRDALVQSIAPLLEFVHVKQSKKKKRGAKAWPIVKMIEFVCATADVGEQAAQDAKSKQSQEEKSEPQVEVMGEPVLQESPSPWLLASIQIATFLSKENQGMGTAFLRALCKYLGGVDLDLENERSKDLSTLKSLMEELEMEISDATSLRSLSKLSELLVDIAIREEESVADDDQESLTDALNKVALSDDHSTATTVTEKENEESIATSMDKGRMSNASSIGSRRSSLYSRRAN